MVVSNGAGEDAEEQDQAPLNEEDIFDPNEPIDKEVRIGFAKEALDKIDGINL